MTDGATGASVPIGDYSLDVGTATGSFARFEPQRETDNLRELATALGEKPSPLETIATAIEKFEGSASAVTGRIEEAEGLLRAAAEGSLLEPGHLTGEIDSLLDLFGRLDKAGRFEEELSLMRSLNGLLALSLRWLELVRSLRSLLASAEVVGHKIGEAWANHELGSLYLCAGKAKDAARHLNKALDIESELGDIAGRCATRHNLDAARRELADPSVQRGRSPRRVVRLALLAAAFAGLGAICTSIAYAIHDGGEAPVPAAVAFTVEQNFEPDRPRASAAVSVQCTEGGVPDASSKLASESAPVVFAISDFGNDATCTATARNTPPGYTTDASDCLNVSITETDSVSCTITSTRRRRASVAFVVTMDFEPGVQTSVGVRVSCTKGGRPDASSKSAREGTPAVFVITRFGSGATCTATEGVAPTGYTRSENGCRSVAIAKGSPAACTIINTLKPPASIIFTVAKDFEPDDADGSVTISVSCSDGVTPDASPKPAREGAPAVFTIRDFSPGATCTATEGDEPPGYASGEDDCAEVVIAERRSCTIRNTLSSATFSVGVAFTDGNTRSVVIFLTCDSGSVEPERGNAQAGSPAVFTVTGFTEAATCSVTGAKPPSGGYGWDPAACQSVPLDTAECTLEFSPPE